MAGRGDRWGRLSWVLLVAVLALALTLRLKGVAWGLPYSFVNVDESTVLPKAFAAARGHLNPQFFYYPSLFFYLIGGVYDLIAPVWRLLGRGDFLAAGAFVVDAGPYFLVGRLVSVAMGTASVYLLYRLGRAAFGRPAGLVAALLLAVVPLHVAYSHMAVTDVTAAALSLAAFLLLHAAACGRGKRWLVAGAAVAGLATSTKYNLGMLVLPATLAAVYACRGEAERRMAAGGRAALVWLRLLLGRVWAPMLGAFVAASPFVVLDAGHFVRDFLRQGDIMKRGWLGFEHVGNGFTYNLVTNLGGTLGVVLFALALAGLAWAVWRHTRLDLLVAPYVIVYFVYIGTWKELAGRYLLPILPLLLLLAARGCLEALGLTGKGAEAPEGGSAAKAAPASPGGASRGGPRRRLPRRAAVPLAVVLLGGAMVVPLADSVAYVRHLSGVDTRQIAKEWIEENVPSGTVIATENYGPPLADGVDVVYYRRAGVTTPVYRVLRVNLPAPGEANRRHSMWWLESQGAEYVVLSSRVYDRVLAAADVYPGLVRFYARLEEEADLVRVIAPGAGERGPVLKVYRLRPRS